MAQKFGCWIFSLFLYVLKYLFCHFLYTVCKSTAKNSKVFEQKGDLLNFKANIDPMAVLSHTRIIAP